MRGMTTNVGQNWQGILWMAMGVITTMDPGWERTTLLAFSMIVMAVVAFVTKGSGLSTEDSQRIVDRMDDEEIQRLLDEDRHAPH